MTAATTAENKPRQPLFRSEVTEARRAQWLGSIRIGRPVSSWLMASAALGVAAALVGFACWGQVSRKVTLHGVLLPAGGLLNVAAPQPGVVDELLVQEGDVVEAGQPLVRLKSQRITATGDAAVLTAQAIAARRATLETERRLTDQNLRQRLESLQQRQQSLQAEERQAFSELDTHSLRLQLAQTSLDRQQQLAREGFVAAAQVQQKQEEQLDLVLRQRNAQRNLQALQRDLQTVRADRETLETQSKTVLAQLDRSMASLEQEATEADGRSGLTLTAPRKSVISALTLSAGQAVQAGQTLVSLVPAAVGDEGQLRAQLFAPSRTAGFLRNGQDVWLRYAAFPYQKFGMARGEVISVSSSPIAPEDLPNGQAQALIAAAQSNEPMYRITVVLPAQTVNTYGRQSRLTAGMALDADVRLDSRKVWEWLIEPALAVGGKQFPS